MVPLCHHRSKPPAIHAFDKLSYFFISLGSYKSDPTVYISLISIDIYDSQHHYIFHIKKFSCTFFFQISNMKIPKLCCRRSAESNSESRTPVFQRFSCGIGGILGEITSQILSFRLVFFMNVLGLSATNAGWLVVYGKISQALAQPLCAFLGNRIKIPFLSRKLGRKKSWHFIGTTMITIVLPLYFASCFPCRSDGGQWQLMMYILALSTVVSTGFGLVELGHVSIIPVISKNQAEAIELNAWRFAYSNLPA